MENYYRSMWTRSWPTLVFLVFLQTTATRTVAFSAIKGRTPLFLKLASIASDIFQPVDDPSLYYNSEELIRASGYPSEAHRVVTEDGYELMMHRIPYNSRHTSGYSNRQASGYNSRQTSGYSNKQASRNKKTTFKFHYGVSSHEVILEEPNPTHRTPVLLQHGLSAASDCWLVQGPHRDLAYLLSDAGYDVWLGNARGTYYSRKHKNLTTNDSKFWDFSMEEMGIYDLPAVIDYILNATESDKLHYVGHSMGTTMFFIMASMKQSYEYVNKIRSFSGLAPVHSVNRENMSPQKQTLFQALRKILDSYGQQNIQEILPRVNWAPMLLNAFCRKGSSFQNLCSDIGFFWAGVQAKRISKKRLAIMVSHVPAGMSLKTLNHYLQNAWANTFQRYDYGKEGNLKRYGQEKPPQYDLSHTTCPVSLYYSEGDHLVESKNVLKLMKDLPKTAHAYQIDDYNHVDFIWASDASKDVYPKIIQNINSYNDLLYDSSAGNHPMQRL